MAGRATPIRKRPEDEAMPADILPPLIGGLIAGSITMVSWFVADFQKRKDAQRNRQAEFIQRQLYELYAPLYMLALKEHGYRELRRKVMGAVSKEREWEAWRKASDLFVMPAQRAIFDLLQSKWHLLIDVTPPASFYAVLDHCCASLSLYELDRAGLGNLTVVRAESMPDQFRQDVEAALRELQESYTRLIGVRPRQIVAAPPAPASVAVRAEGLAK
jgi:hypothetical protein